MERYRYFEGTVPLIVSIPHAGVEVPESLRARLTPEASALPDTDWHVERLYQFARGMGAHVLVATHSRYVVDVNRAPDGSSLYPGSFTTGVCPTTLFDGTPLYRSGQELDDAEIALRVATYWQPYHDRLQSIIDRMGHGKVCVWDAHSICAQVPLLFEGTLPDLNIGTADGASADEVLVQQVMQVAQSSAYSSVLNGRFKGGYITRHYGKPEQSVHTIQLELAQHTYMHQRAPYPYDETNAERLQITLQAMLARVLQWLRS